MKDAGVTSFNAQRVVFIVIIVLHVLFFQDVKAQTIIYDTTTIIEKIIEEKDTMIRYEISGWSKPIDSMFLKNSNTRFKKELYNLIFKDNGSIPVREPLAKKNGSFEGKIIRHISFNSVNIFAPTVTDTNYSSSNRFQRTFDNGYHTTRPEVLERYLLFEAGDKLDLFLAAENERILRDLSFIMDARFIFKEVEGSHDSVDIVLLTQDKFPIGLEADFENSSIASLGIAHHNLFGYGQSLSSSAYYNARKKSHFGYSFSYGTSNFAGTFVSSRLSYIHTWSQETYSFEFSRNFRAISFRNAGGIYYESTAIQRNIELLDTTFNDAIWKYSATDIWAGRMIKLINNSDQMRSGLFVAARIYQYQSYELPLIEEQYLFPYQNRMLLLASTGISTQGFRKDNMIYTFGRTEDVPFGYLFNLVTGIEWSEYNKRYYLSPGASYGSYLRNSSYLYGQIRYETFLDNGKTEQGAIKIQMKYFSPLHKHNRYRYRNFVTLTYLKGIDRYPGEYTTIGNQEGIMGLASSTMRGTQKYVLNLESVLFSPYVLLGFHFAFFGGLDLGLIKRNNSRFDDSRLFSGLSMGVRIRNDKLVFDTFVIKLAVYPGKPEDAMPQNFIIDNMAKTKFNDFFPYKPAILNYQ